MHGPLSLRARELPKGGSAATPADRSFGNFKENH